MMHIKCNKDTFPDCQDNFVEINNPVIAHSHNDYEQDIEILWSDEEERFDKLNRAVINLLPLKYT